MSSSENYIDYVKVKGKFDPMFDGQMKLAQDIVRYVKDSNNFDKKIWPGQEEFYVKYMTYWEELKDKLYNIKDYRRKGKFIFSYKRGQGPSYISSDEDVYSDEENYNEKIDLSRSFNDKCIESLDKVLYELVEQNKLSLYHLLVAYILVIIEMNSRYIYPEGYIHRFECDTNMTIEKLNKISNKYKKDKIIPFNSPKGAFGFNTFLYLYFNGLSPVGISTYFHKIHPRSSDYNNPLNVIEHDFIHIYNFFHGLDNIYIKLYINLMYNQKELTENEVKLYIICLFVIIHEKEFDISNFAYDNSELLLKIIKGAKYQKIKLKMITDLLKDLVNQYLEKNEREYITDFYIKEGIIDEDEFIEY